MIETTTVDAVAKHLHRLSLLCDSGFALAIHIRYTRPSLLYRTYHQAWIDHYSEQGFMLSDPVVHWGLAQTGSVNWADLAAHDNAGVLSAAKSHGLANGWTYATGPATSRTIAGLTKTGADFTRADRDSIIAIVNDLHALTEGLETLPPDQQDGLRALG